MIGSYRHIVRFIRYRGSPTTYFETESVSIVACFTYTDDCIIFTTLELHQEEKLMGVIYAMSDIHGEVGAFLEALRVVEFDDPRTILILLGDYIDHGHEHMEIYPLIMSLQKKYPDQVMVLAGNNDVDLYNAMTDYGNREILGSSDPMSRVLRWIKNLPFYHKTPTQIFVHAGVDEEADDVWEWGCDEEFFLRKFPPSRGTFRFDVIAGHVGSCSIELSGDPDFHEVFWDGASHFYLDGSSERTHYVPVLKYDEETCQYTTFKFEGPGNVGDWAEVPMQPYQPEG